MQNIIALIWDFDKTLINGYMQDPIFNDYNVDPTEFWHEVNSLPKKYKDEQNVRVNPDTIYLNRFIHYAQNGKFKGLCNDKLKAYGAKQNFYKGIPEIFKYTKQMFDNDAVSEEYNIKVEHYIVSTGFAAVIRGTVLMDYVENVWGCELIEKEQEDGSKVISELGYTFDNMMKTQALFEINKGVNKNPEISVNSKMNAEQRRIDFRNMIYIADGPSDIPAFSVVKERGGATFAIYPHGDAKAFAQVEKMREDGRVDMFAEADYSKDTTSFMWITNKIQEIADRIKAEEQVKHSGNFAVPHHLV